MSTNEFMVTGMSCAHCESAVRSEVGQIEGVQQVDVSAATGKLVVRGEGSIDDAAVIAAVGEAGYTAVHS